MVAFPRWAPLKGSGTEFGALLGGVVLWEGLGHLLALPWLPPFSRTFAALISLIGSGVIIDNLFASLRGLAIGFGFSLVVGLTVGALMARYRKVEYALDIYVNAMIFAPAIVFAPIFFTIFGLSDITRIAVIVLYALFIMVINTFTGMRTVDTALLEMARSFGASERHIFFRILIPASLPVVFAGIRLGMGRAVRGMINGEMFIAFVGLGALAQRFGGQFDASKVLAISLVILVVALFMNWLVQALDHKLTNWAD
jgi:NitT/TauT family transport system permease protein